jgi:hypothetical protein
MQAIADKQDGRMERTEEQDWGRRILQVGSTY